MARTFFSGQGYFAELAPANGKAPRFKHTLCGPQDVPGAECMTCRRPLLLMLTLDLTDKRLKFITKPQRVELLLLGKGPEVTPDFRTLTDLPLYYCWACGNPLTYRLNKGGGVDVLDHTRLTMADFKPERPDYPQYLPARRLRLTPIPHDVQKLIHRSNQGELKGDEKYSGANSPYLRPRHQIGGEPYLVQGNASDSRQTCDLCDKDMPIVAVVGDECGRKGGFVGDAFVQVIFHCCDSCQVVVAMNECD
jgi:hypothetical protein